MFNSLFPASEYETGFTTARMDLSAGSNTKIHQVELSDPALGVHKSNDRFPHNLVTPPHPNHGSVSPECAWEALYPPGSINPSGSIPGGFGFYLSGPENFAARLRSASEALFSYRVMFESEWEWVKGGKLPGAFGGVGDLSYRCSGGRQDQRCKCFSLRLMWRAGGKGEIYAYIPMNDTNDQRLRQVPPESRKNPDYGFSVGRGAFKFHRGSWTTIAQRVKLNAVGFADGEVELWVDGVSVIKITGLILREEQESRIKGIHFQTFFGGNSSEWASPKDQKAWFADVSGAIIR